MTERTAERHRAEISALLSELEPMQRAMPEAFQAEDMEAFEIVRRIERRLLGLRAPQDSERVAPRDAE